MNNKYLPIGTIVKLKSIDKQIMIIGYYSIEYQNSVKIFDYIGCSYPEGMLIKNNSYSFNHSDIEKIDYIGYKNESYNVLNNILNNQKTSGVTKSNVNFANFKFDSNGVVIYEEPIKNEINTNNNVSEEINIRNPFEYTTTESVKSNTPKMNYKFDENGIVVKEEAKNNLKNIQENLDIAINNNWQVVGENYEGIKYTFDANGNVISEASTAKPKVSNESKNNVSYQFDANGNVISESSSIKPKASNESKNNTSYQFDANGNVISEKKDKSDNLELPKTKSPKKENYTFDANGIVIEAN